MTERSILFSQKMIHAILWGPKIQTRRTRGLKSINEDPNNWLLEPVEINGEWYFKNSETGLKTKIKCPYGKAGDQLWVREKFHIEYKDYLRFPTGIICYNYSTMDKRDPEYYDGVSYGYFSKEIDKNSAGKLIDSDLFDIWKARKTKWYSSIHMPRKFSRIQLQIIKIRIEKLNDISFIDCLLEGVGKVHGKQFEYAYENAGVNLIESFRKLWKSINGDLAWIQNPFVWAIEFKRING